MSPVYVFDPTTSDRLSKVRGVGRYIQLLKENFAEQFTFTNNLSRVPRDATLINPFFDPLKTPLLMKRVAKKQIAVIHDLIPLKYPEQFPSGIRGNINIYLNKLSLKVYDLIITVSQTSKKDITRILKIPPEKIKVVYSTISFVFLINDGCLEWRAPDTRAAPPSGGQALAGGLTRDRSHRQSKQDSYFLYVGDATWNKNLVNLAKAIQIADVKCVFVGKVFVPSNKYEAAGVSSGGTPTRAHPRLWRGSTGGGVNERQDPRLNLSHSWQKELKEFLTITENDNRFIFPGFISDEELINLYKNAVANVLVSRDEGFGFSYFEASSQTTPSLLSNIALFKETAEDTALFADPENPEDIADKLKKLQNDKTLREQLGKKAQTRLKLFSREKFKEDFLELL